MRMTRPAPASRRTIAVVGLGSIGGAIAATLQQAGRHDVLVCTRKPIACLDLEYAGGSTSVPLRALTDAGAATPVDWVLLCTKAHQTASAAPWLSALCNPSTRVAVLQNGIDHAARIAPFANRAVPVSTVVYYNGERLGQDRVRLSHVADHDLAVAAGAEGRSFAELLQGTPLRVLLSDDLPTLAWRKLLLNVVANPITALTLQRQAVLRRPDVHALCLAILEEAVVVAKRDGARLAPDEPDRIMATLFSFPPHVGTSMYFDRLAGKDLEIDALTGAIVRAGERLGIPTPLNSAVLALLRAVSDAAAGGEPRA
jgi:2-dehydropantoate 2-reductase